MSVAQGLRRAAAPLRSCAARYLGGAASSCSSFAAAATFDVRASQCFLSRMLSTETDSGILSQPKPLADQGLPQPTPVSPPNPAPRLVFRRTGDPTTVGPDVSAAPYRPSANGPQKVSARISNTPKFMFKSDLLWFLKGCNLRPEDLTIMFDTKYRSKYVQVNFSSVESFRLAQRTLAMKGRLGGRYLKLTQEEPQMDDINVVLQQFRGRSLLMLKVPTGVATEDVERFFAGYILDTNHPVKFLRSMVQGPSGGRRPSAVAARPEFELKALVRFRTEAEAFRALREKQGSYCLEKSVDLRFIE